MRSLQCTITRSAPISGPTPIPAGARKSGRKNRTKIMSRNSSTLYTRYRRWRRYRETVRELQSLSTHELNDLGIRRGEISRLAREASRL